MSTADIIAIIAFLALVLLGLFAMTVQDALRKRPTGRVRTRLQGVARQSVQKHAQKQPDRSQFQRDARRRQRREAMGALGQHLARIEVTSGKRGFVLLSITAALLFIVGLIVALLAPLPLWGKLLAVFLIPAIGVYNVYKMLVGRYRLKFLDQLPDIIDMIIRASQAGVPVPQALQTIGDEFDWPAGPEFQRMGHALQLGGDIDAVLTEAEQRIEVPDFSFLCVSLMLQRETGGSLSETLSNLAAVVRARRDLRLKVRALTAEGRMSSAIIGALPFIILGLMSFANPEYMAVLYTTESGHKLLTVAGIMLALGLLLVRKIARLET